MVSDIKGTPNCTGNPKIRWHHFFIFSGLVKKIAEHPTTECSTIPMLSMRPINTLYDQIQAK
jgi:hypothetical protein